MVKIEKMWLIEELVKMLDLATRVLIILKFLTDVKVKTSTIFLLMAAHGIIGIIVFAIYTISK